MVLFLLRSGIFVTLVAVAYGECSNGCSGHGRCVLFDHCVCNRNWQGPDCNERICQFGLAWVDTPKGDLDASGTISGPNENIVRNSELYPFGTTEQWPEMKDSDFNILENSGHYYMECSNNGVCDRSTGECICLENFYGVSCQRRMCPGYPIECSGHGRCLSKQQLAQLDNNNVYMMWDKDKYYGCKCDGGYYGGDCSLRKCKVGIDPHYLDDIATVRFATWDFAVLTTDPYTNFVRGTTIDEVDITGTWAIKFYDSFGEDWLTEPILAGASCSEVLLALENLPNNVVPKGTATCVLTSRTSTTATDNDWYQNIPKTTLHLSKSYNIYYNLSIWEAVTSPLEDEDTIYNEITQLPGTADHTSYAASQLTGYIYRIRFFGNPGSLKQPDINVYLSEHSGPSLVSPGYKVITKVWSDGQRGEYDDYFADHCKDVSVTIAHWADPDPAVAALGQGYWLDGMTATEKNLFKKCLGSSDFDISNNVEVPVWDYGSLYYPHVVKLVRTVTTYIDGGYFAVIYYTDDGVNVDSSGSTGVFRLLNPWRLPDAILTDNYDVFTTKGTLALTSNESQAIFSFASKYIYMVNSSYETNLMSLYDGDLSCEINENNAFKLQHMHYCLNKSDIITFLANDLPGNNPPNINFYRVERLYTKTTTHLKQDVTNLGYIANHYTDSNKVGTQPLHYMTHVITTDISTNWGSSHYDGIVANYPTFRIYKFFPAVESMYKVVSECSSRGICNTNTGLCECFPGYTNDECSIIDALAL